jgi:hypothetical protein
MRILKPVVYTKVSSANGKMTGRFGSKVQLHPEKQSHTKTK